jgi:hypothetical protein
VIKDELLLTATLPLSTLEVVENNDFCIKLNKIIKYISFTFLYIILYK